MRITRPQMFMEIAQVVSRRSTCMRLNVGAVIVQGRTIVSIGYNGTPAGLPHCQGNSCRGRHRCSETVHAEDNALRHLPLGVEGPLDLYVTDSPCPACYDLLLRDSRVKRLFFQTPYRITDHLENSLWESSIEVYRVLPAGYVMDWNTKELVDVKT
jgi:dCMP deaminase